MFVRSTKRHIIRELREAVWPTMGWDRAMMYYKHRLLRTPGSTYKIVGGLAVGMAVSFLPLLGTHWIEAIFLGWVMRVNKFAAWVGTGIGNPLTFPLMFWADYKIGAYIFGIRGMNDRVMQPDQITWHHFLENPMGLFLPMLLGGVILAIVVWPIAYALLYYPIRAMRRGYRDYRHG